MAEEDSQLVLAMPVGLPGEGDDPAAFFTDLSGKLEASVSGDVISVWTDPAAEYSGIYPMIKSAAWYVKAGNPGADGTTPVSADTLYCKTWLWEYIDLSASAGGGSALPAVIAYSGLEEAQVQADVTAELTDNAKYANMTDQERTDGAAAFIAGDARMVVEAGTRLGMGQVDGSHPNGWRKVEIALYDADLNLLDPSFYFTLWDTVGGEMVESHPLIALVQGPVTPATAPVEGGIRVKITGTGLSDATPVTFGGVAATDVRVKPDGTGTVLYATVPAGTSGTVDVVVDGTTHAGAFAYTEDVAATAQASLSSYVLYIGELTDLANAYAAAGTLDEAKRSELRDELEQAASTAGEVIEQRSANAGAAAMDPAVGEMLSDAIASLETLIDGALSAIG